MKKKIVISMLGFFINTLSMEQTSWNPFSWFTGDRTQQGENNTKELAEQLGRLLTIISLKKTKTVDELIINLDDLSQRKGNPEEFSRTIRILYSQLIQIKDAITYDQTLKAIEELSKKEYLALLFNNPDFTQLLIYSLHEKAHRDATIGKHFEAIAKDIGTVGAKQWLNNRILQLQLIQAAGAREYETVNNLLNKGISVNSKDDLSNTALMYATEKNDKTILDLLIKAGADNNAQNNYGFTALIIAVQSGCKEIVELLMDEKADINVKDNDGYTALMWAIFRGHKEIAELLIDKKADVNIKDNNGYTALIHAARYGDRFTLAKLVSSNAEELTLVKDAITYDKTLKAIKELSKEENLAPLFNNPDFTQLLLSDLREKARTEAIPGKTFEVIAEDINTVGAKLWLDGRAQQQALFQAIGEGDNTTVSNLLNKGVNSNAKNNLGYTALLWAIYLPRQQSKEIVKALLDKKADITINSPLGETPLTMAVHKDHKEIVELLISSKATVNDQDRQGCTALMWAAYNGASDIVSLLLNAGAIIDIKDKNGNTALDLAKNKGHAEIVQLLEKHGAKDTI